MDAQALRDYFHFDEDDLAANRMGEYSEKQKQRLVKQDKGRFNTELVIGLGALAIFLVLLGVLVFFRDFDVAVMVFMAICLVLAYYTLRSAYNTNKGDVPKEVRELKKLEGPVRIDQDGRSNHVYLHIQGERWGIQDGIAGSFHQGDTYVVYYGGNAGDILSVEWISTPTLAKIP
jgi:membrane protein implicated in regulation of membrane protease activity